jgi:hypothetical protein
MLKQQPKQSGSDNAGTYMGWTDYRNPTNHAGSRVILGKLAVAQLVKKFPALCEILRFVTASVSPKARWIQFTPYLSYIHFNIILPYTLDLPNYIPFRFSSKNSAVLLISPRMQHSPPSSFSIIWSP